MLTMQCDLSAFVRIISFSLALCLVVLHCKCTEKNVLDTYEIFSKVKQMLTFHQIALKLFFKEIKRSRRW